MSVTAGEFLEALFDGMPAGRHTILTAFAGDPTQHRKGIWAGRPWWPGQMIPSWYPGSGPVDLHECNCYLTVSAFDPDPETGKRLRRKAQFVRMHCVMVDDVGDGLGSKIAPAQLRLPPSALVETSPRNTQAFYFLTDDADARCRQRCELIVKRMIEAGLTTDHRDPGMRGVTRFGRLPLGINGKRLDGRLKYPADFRCREIAWHPERRYSIPQITEAWGLSPETLPERAPITKVTAVEARRCARRFDSLLRLLAMLGLLKGRNSAGWYDIVCPWVHEHTDRADNGAALAAPSEGNAWQGAFRCHHSHGEELHIRHVWAFVREIGRRVQP